MVSEEKIHRAFRTHTTLWTKLIRENYHFHHLPKLYIGFNDNNLIIALSFFFSSSDFSALAEELKDELKVNQADWSR